MFFHGSHHFAELILGTVPAGVVHAELAAAYAEVGRQVTSLMGNNTQVCFFIGEKFFREKIFFTKVIFEGCKCKAWAVPAEAVYSLLLFRKLFR